MNRSNYLSGHIATNNTTKLHSNSLKGWGNDKGVNLLGNVAKCDQKYQNYFQILPSSECDENEKT